MSHVFVAPGDVTHLASDAWLLPTDRELSIRPHWYDSVPALPTRESLRDLGRDMQAGRSHTLVLPGWSGPGPEPVLVAVPFHGIENPGQVVAPLQEGLRVAASVARRRVELRSRNGRRGLPLVALPLFGAAGGGGDALRGELIRAVLDVATRVGDAESVDVALVLREAADLAQAHAIRRATPGTSWRELDQDLVVHAGELAGHAHAGRLVPFIGAGVSATAGLPLWNELVASLSGDLPAAEREDFDRLNVLDQAHVLRHLHGDRAAFTRAIAERTNGHRYGLAPALLAGLPTRETVTLNYDTLYETAARDVGRPAAVLPWEPVTSQDRWLLKLHGSVHEPESIVLTREDYLGYRHGREALSALAKAMLLTRHLLFVGFGLADDHFHELMHDVREVLPPAQRAGQKLGTAVALSSSLLRERMWGADLTLVGIGGDDVPQQARRLEIFLDCLLAHADRGLPHFLDERYQQRLEPAERQLADRLGDLWNGATDAERGTAAWDRVRQLIRDLGGPTT